VDDEPTHNRTPAQYRIAVAAFFFVSGFGYATFASRIPFITNQLHLTEGRWGTVLFSLPVGLVSTMPFIGWLLTRYSTRAMMLFGTVFLGVVLVALGFAGNVWPLAFSLFFFGIARNFMTLSVNTQAVAVQGLYKKSIMTTFHGIWSMAGFGGAALGLIMVYFNVVPKWHFLAVAIVLDIIAFCFIKYTLNQKPAPRAPGPLFSRPDKYLLKFSLICFCCMACENTMYDWSALYFQKQVSPEKVIASAAFAIYLVAMTAGRFFGDRIVTRAGIKTVLRFSGLFIFAGLLIAVTFPYPVPVILGFILVGLGVSSVVPMVFSLAGKSANMSSSSALASISTVGYLGFVLVPPLVGWVAKVSNLRVSFAIIALLGGAIVYLVSKIQNDSHQGASPAAISAAQIE
jgi:MFS family permease